MWVSVLGASQKACFLCGVPLKPPPKRASPHPPKKATSTNTDPSRKYPPRPQKITNRSILPPRRPPPHKKKKIHILEQIRQPKKEDLRIFCSTCPIPMGLRSCEVQTQGSGHVMTIVFWSLTSFLGASYERKGSDASIPLTGDNPSSDQGKSKKYLREA